MIAEANYAEDMRNMVEPALAEIEQKKRVAVKDGEIAVYCYVPSNARKLLLLLHGFTESAEKFHEVIYYFVQEGYGVIAMDHRGHGKSLRLVDDGSLIHVDHFSDYVEDARQVVEQVMRPLYPAPYALYAHSMGGAVGAMLVMRMPEMFDRVILSSPMIAPSSGGIPRWVGKGIADANCLIGRGRKMAFIGSAYDADKDIFETSNATSPVRFQYYKDKRAGNTALHTCAPSYRWVSEAVRVTGKLLNPQNARAIQARVLLCQAGKDTVVCLPEQQAFIDLVPQGRLELFPDSRHEIYLSGDDEMSRYIEILTDFLSDR